MPRRMIEGDIVTSRKLNSLSDFEFRLWATLLVLVDDYGCGDARPEIIKGFGFPLRTQVTASDIQHGLEKLAEVGCLIIYEVNGEPYLQLSNWADHQRLRNSKHQVPPPEQGRVKSPQVAASCRELPPEVEVEVEEEVETEEEVNDGGGRARAHAYVREDDFGTPWDEFVKSYEQNIGLFPTSRIEQEDMQMFFEEYGPEVLGEIIAITVRKHPENPHRYFSAICRNWLGKGIKTLEQARAAFADFERKGENRTRAQPASKAPNPALDYPQREYREEDFGDDFFINLDEYARGEKSSCSS